VSEGEDTGSTGESGAGGFGEILHWTSTGLSVGAVSPVVDHHCPIGINLCSTPWSRTVSIGALVILLVLVFEWEHTDSVVLGHAWVGDSAARLGSGEVERVCLAGSESEGENDEAPHDDGLWRCSTQN